MTMGTPNLAPEPEVPEQRTTIIEDQDFYTYINALEDQPRARILGIPRLLNSRDFSREQDSSPGSYWRKKYRETIKDLVRSDDSRGIFDEQEIQAFDELTDEYIRIAGAIRAAPGPIDLVSTDIDQAMLHRLGQVAAMDDLAQLREHNEQEYQRQFDKARQTLAQRHGRSYTPKPVTDQDVMRDLIYRRARAYGERVQTFEPREGAVRVVDQLHVQGQIPDRLATQSIQRIRGMWQSSEKGRMQVSQADEDGLPDRVDVPDMTRKKVDRQQEMRAREQQAQRMDMARQARKAGVEGLRRGAVHDREELKESNQELKEKWQEYRESKGEKKDKKPEEKEKEKKDRKSHDKDI
jgi:hypothetical protein